MYMNIPDNSSEACSTKLILCTQWNKNIVNLNTIIIDAVKLRPYLYSNISKTYWTSNIIFSLAYHLKYFQFSIILQIKH
jgi:hypothetical protein